MSKPKILSGRTDDKPSINVSLVYPETNLNGNPPLGLAYIAAVLEENNIHVSFLDCTVHSIHEVVREVIENKPLIVGIYASTLLYNNALEISKSIKQVAPEIYTCLGGPHPTVNAEEVISNNTVDFVVYGEGEHTFLELVKTLKRCGDLRGIKGILFKNGSDVVVNPPRPPIEDISSLPFPARHLLPMYINIGYRYL